MQPCKTGYLHDEFRIFYLTSAEARDFQSHYHDFHKLLFFESGSVSYYIEGETYQLQPNDLVLVPAGEVHRPVIHDTAPYHRLILYISPDFFKQYDGQQLPLDYCFRQCSGRGSHVLRTQNFRECRLYPLLEELKYSALAKDRLKNSENNTSAQCAEKASIPGFPMSDAALSLYQRSVLLQLLLLLPVLAENGGFSLPAASITNPQILQVLSYINNHLREELTVDRIADTCYLNRSWLMHLFRRETGYTLLGYITEKRLFAARTLIQSGYAVTDACLASGFSSYASFYRAYRRKFGEAPKDSR